MKATNRMEEWQAIKTNCQGAYCGAQKTSYSRAYDHFDVDMLRFHLERGGKQRHFLGQPGREE